MAVDGEKFPLLYRQVHKTRLGWVAYNLMQEMAKRETPLLTSTDGSAWYAESLDYLVSSYGGSKRTWSSSISLLVTVGLLNRVKPDEATLNPLFHQLYVEGASRGRVPKSVYSVPAYTPELFRRAEAVLQEWQETGVSTTKVTKASTINALGQAAANGIFRDGRQKSYQPEAQRIIKRIVCAVQKRGYLTKAEAVGEDERAWQIMHKYILTSANARYRKPTGNEKRLFGLTNDKWIITEDKP